MKSFVDSIYVPEKGSLIELGGQQELLLQKGLYYAMWLQQISERKMAGKALPA